MPRLLDQINRAWLSLSASTSPEGSLSIGRKSSYLIIILLTAGLFRYYHFIDLMPAVIHGQQDFAGITSVHNAFAKNYFQHGISAVFPTDWQNPADTSLLQYPPGYGIWLSTIYLFAGKNLFVVQFLQALLDAITALLIFLIALEFFHSTVALIAGLAVAISHHLGYYSMLLLPDGVVPFFVVAGTYLVIKGCRATVPVKKDYLALVGGGICYGLSCWLRADSMMLWLFWVIICAMLAQPFGRITPIIRSLRRSLVITLAMLAVIAPLTIRNYLIYHHFIPISLGVGIALQEGLGEADGSLGIPFGDGETMIWESQLYQQPSYRTALLTPDGITRERERTRRSLLVIADRPWWYLTVMLARVNLMMKYSAHAPLIRSQGTGRDYLRPLLNGLQRGLKESFIFLMILGSLIALKNFRGYLMLITIPCYNLFVHSLMHTEFRYGLSTHYFLAIFYALAIYSILIVLPKLMLKKGNILGTQAEI